MLLLGPLYHLVDREDRLRALGEARRVLRSGGWLFASAISRYAALLDLLVRVGRLHEPEVFRVVAEAVNTGVFKGIENSLFTTAYFHLPQELAGEISEVGFELCTILNIEGPAFLLRDLERDWADGAKRQTFLEAGRLIEEKPEMLAASSHILAVART